VKTCRRRFTDAARSAIEVAFKNDGTLTGLRYSVFADLGAYHQLLTPAIPTLTGIDAFRRLQDSRDSDEYHRLLHKQDGDRRISRRRPAGSDLRRRARAGSRRRGTGRRSAEVRAKTSLLQDEFPFHTATGLDYDSGDYEAALNKAQEIAVT
jgi:carbon-monoxide dehydrogenase large subunit